MEKAKGETAGSLVFVSILLILCEACSFPPFSMKGVKRCVQGFGVTVEVAKDWALAHEKIEKNARRANILAII
jgi:hypothetical protein